MSAAKSSTIAVIGAGPAGLAAAKLALERGHRVTVFEKYSHLGGIWNPHSGGAYASVRMQTSRGAFHYSDHLPDGEDGLEFLTRQDVYDYLRSYSRCFGIEANIVYNTEVTRVEKSGGRWTVATKNGGMRGSFDRVIVANGELWRSRTLPADGTHPPTAKDYAQPHPFAGQKMLVVGGGVSGADIAAELSSHAREVHWSIRKPALLLPRKWGTTVNDGCFSYVARYEVQNWERERYLGFLQQAMPEYMSQYTATGLLPEQMSNHAIHVNDTAIPAVASGKLTVRPGVRFVGDAGKEACFLDGTSERYDTILVCAGYQPPDYSFIQDFSMDDLYEYFFFRKDPTLAVLNTPSIADGYGTACPYFEAIAYWVLQVFDEERSLPPAHEMEQWCADKAAEPFRKVFYDCWLETIRIGLLSGQLPDPATEFSRYWHVVSNGVTPANLHRKPEVVWQPAFDSLVDMERLRLRILAGFPDSALGGLVETGQVLAEETERSRQFGNAAISPGLC